MFRGSDDWCLHARIMLALSNIHRAVITAQVKGSANIMAIVAATQELKAGDFLLRFKAEASQDDTHKRPAGVWKLLIHMGFFSLACRAFLLFFRWFTCFVFLLMFDILYMVTTHACG